MFNYTNEEIEEMTSEEIEDLLADMWEPQDWGFRHRPQAGGWTPQAHFIP